MGRQFAAPWRNLECFGYLNRPGQLNVQGCCIIAARRGWVAPSHCLAKRLQRLFMCFQTVLSKDGELSSGASIPSPTEQCHRQRRRDQKPLVRVAYGRKEKKR